MSEIAIDIPILCRLNKIVKAKHVFSFLIVFAVVIFTFGFLGTIWFILWFGLGCGLSCVVFKYRHGLVAKLTELYSKKCAQQNFDECTLYKKNCDICKGKKCQRYLKQDSDEPWVDLLVHKQFDQAVENFFNVIIKTFITTWYSKLSHDDSFQGELKYVLRYASSSLLRRGLKVNISKVIVEKLTPCILRHYTLCSDSQNIMINEKLANLEEAALQGPLKHALHSALKSRESEMEYLRLITESMMFYLIPKEDIQSKLFTTLIREIFAGWVLLSLTDLLADPNTINTLVILATGNEKMSNLPEFPNNQVEFLEKFVKPNVYKRKRLLCINVPDILKCPEYLYSFMQFMKARGKIHILQFCLDIEEFNKKMLRPEISSVEKISLHKNAMEMFSIYFSSESSSYIPFIKEHGEQLIKILNEGPENINQLQRSRVIFESYDYVFSLLDQEWVPKYFDSNEFYNLIIPNVITETKKHVTPAKFEKSNSSVIGKPLSKLKDAFKVQTVDGLILDVSDSGSKTATDSDSMDGVDIEMQYSNILANYTRLKNKDMSSWRVSIEEVTEKKAKNKAGVLHWFVININKIDPHGMGDDSQWSVERTDRDFHILKDKLIEFHGESILGDIYIPSKRVKAASELRKLKYEVFLQYLLNIPLLKSSDLLHLFLTANADFSILAKEASSDSPFLDFGNLYQTVSHKLRKEKGQHLDLFLQTFLISADLGYYKSLNEEKKKMLDCEEEATDIVNDMTMTSRKINNGRYLMNSIFGNNFNVKQNKNKKSSLIDSVDKKWNFENCLFFILNDVFQVRNIVVAFFDFLCQFTNYKVINILEDYMNKILKRILSPRRLGHLIKLGQDLIFSSSVPSTLKIDRNVKLKIAKTQLKAAFPFYFIKLMGPNFLIGADRLLDYLQNPKLNKQLVYTLFDVLLVELFPELTGK